MQHVRIVLYVVLGLALALLQPAWAENVLACSAAIAIECLPYLVASALAAPLLRAAAPHAACLRRVRLWRRPERTIDSGRHCNRIDVWSRRGHCARVDRNASSRERLRAHDAHEHHATLGRRIRGARAARGASQQCAAAARIRALTISARRSPFANHVSA